ncbi:MAG: hypothetical protein GWO41_02580 [candidate division Zixibacteria bacterium]|nr:hypothetical protein [candidate division Zixibacteria bacterium]NIR62453.1 hypothetical protein [candidate division Zixibacteria bacterium]NIS15153.1 hypothetical protein [candidate division Zixibacteria bacterium]NIS44595.1 hypothetical protein [candidate division Zixibacteria bacterium]NIT51650.1 hypothetical protein [candidate division Zixibacteria bacterium]
MTVDRSIDLDEMVIQLSHWKKEIAELKSQSAFSGGKNLEEVCTKIGELQRIIEDLKKKAVMLRWQQVKRLNDLGNQIETAVYDLDQLLHSTIAKFDRNSRNYLRKSG